MLAVYDLSTRRVRRLSASTLRLAPADRADALQAFVGESAAMLGVPAEQLGVLEVSDADEIRRVQHAAEVVVPASGPLIITPADAAAGARVALLKAAGEDVRTLQANLAALQALHHGAQADLSGPIAAAQAELAGIVERFRAGYAQVT